MFDIIVAALCIAICVVAGVWGWWWENGPMKKDEKKDDNNQEERMCKNDAEDECVKSKTDQFERETKT